MSLFTDKFFKSALSGTSAVTTLVGSRIFNTVNDEYDPDAVVTLPYILIVNNGTVNDDESKDDMFESDTDSDKISLTIVADGRSSLASLAQTVRTAVVDTARRFSDSDWATLGFRITDYHFSASQVQFDDLIHAHWQELTYDCETINL